MIAAERARQSSSNRFDDDERLKTKDSVNFATDSVQRKKRESEARSLVRCWKCDCEALKSFECPQREKMDWNRRGDVYNHRRRKQKKLRVRVENSYGSESEGCISDQCGVSVISMLITVHYTLVE